MERNLRKPYTTYDVFAYFFPGAILIAGIWVLGALSWPHFKPATQNAFIREYEFIQNSLPTIPATTWYIILTWVIVGLCGAYILGHLLASIAAIFVDSFVIRRQTGYPFSALLKDKFPLNREGLEKQKFAQASYSYFLTAMVLFAFPKRLGWLAIIFVICSFVMLTLRMGYASWEKHLKRKRKSKFSRYYQLKGVRLVRVICLIFAWPGKKIYQLVILSIYSLTGIYTSFGKETQSDFCNACSQVWFHQCKKQKCKLLPSEIYWRVYCFLNENTEHHRLNIRHWLNLYGFTRNIGVAFLSLYIIGLIVHARGIDTFAMHTWLIATGCLAFFFQYRYVYLYYKYYSKYIARAFIETVSTPANFKRK